MTSYTPEKLARIKVRRIYLNQQGKCAYCGKPLAHNSIARCQICLEMNRKYNQKRRGSIMLERGTYKKISDEEQQRLDNYVKSRLDDPNYTDQMLTDEINEKNILPFKITRTGGWVLRARYRLGAVKIRKPKEKTTDKTMLKADTLIYMLEQALLIANELKKTDDKRTRALEAIKSFI